MSLPKTYTFTQAMDILHVSRRTLFYYLSHGQIKGSKVGGKYIFTEAELKRFITTGTEKGYFVKDNANAEQGSSTEQET